MKYKIVRMYFNGGSRVLKKGLSLEQVQAYLKNPETSSRTAKSSSAIKRTKIMGPWFDGYEED